MNKITITVNGEKKECNEGATVADIAEMLKAGKSAAAELDGEILGKDEFKEHKLKNGSVLELIRIVGGG